MLSDGKEPHKKAPSRRAPRRANLVSSRRNVAAGPLHAEHLLRHKAWAVRPLASRLTCEPCPVLDLVLACHAFATRRITALFQPRSPRLEAIPTQTRYLRRG